MGNPIFDKSLTSSAWIALVSGAMKPRLSEPAAARPPRPPVRKAIDTVRDLAPAVTAISALTATIFHVLYGYRTGVPLLGELAATSFVIVTFAGMVLLVALFQFAAFFPFFVVSGLTEQDQIALRAALAEPDARKRGPWVEAKGFFVCFGWIYWAAFLMLALLAWLGSNETDGLALWALLSLLIGGAALVWIGVGETQQLTEAGGRIASTLKASVPLALHIGVCLAVFAGPVGILMFESSSRAFAWLAIVTVFGAAAFHYFVVSDRFSRQFAVRLGIALAVLAMVIWPGASYLYARALYVLGTGGGFPAEIEMKHFGGGQIGIVTHTRTRCILLVTPSTVFVRAGDATSAASCRVGPLGILDYADAAPLRGVEALSRIEIVRFGAPR
jgi:hypothetical protein